MSGDCLVRDFMTAPVKSISHKARLLDAALVLRSKGIRHLPIVDGDHLVGIITDRDIQRFAPSLLSKITPEEYNAIFENTPLERVMTRDPMTVAPDTPLCEAAGILREQKLGCLPVVEKGRLVGILTVTDLLGVLVHLLNGTDPRQPPDEDV
jgi:CBS domain-containing protein